MENTKNASPSPGICGTRLRADGLDVNDGGPRARSTEGNTLPAAECDFPVHGRVNRPVLADMGILSGPEFVPLLANEHFSGAYRLAAESLDPPSLGATIPAVIGSASSFLMCHSRDILSENLSLARRSSLVHNAMERRGVEQPGSSRGS
jgi:hypothetical protein